MVGKCRDGFFKPKESRWIRKQCQRLECGWMKSCTIMTKGISQSKNTHEHDYIYSKTFQKIFLRYYSYIRLMLKEKWMLCFVQIERWAEYTTTYPCGKLDHATWHAIVQYFTFSTITISWLNLTLLSLHLFDLIYTLYELLIFDNFSYYSTSELYAYVAIKNIYSIKRNELWCTSGNRVQMGKKRIRLRLLRDLLVWFI